MGLCRTLLELFGVKGPSRARGADLPESQRLIARFREHRLTLSSSAAEMIAVLRPAPREAISLFLIRFAFEHDRTGRHPLHRIDVDSSLGSTARALRTSYFKAPYWRHLTFKLDYVAFHQGGKAEIPILVVGLHGGADVPPAEMKKVPTDTDIRHQFRELLAIIS